MPQAVFSCHYKLKKGVSIPDFLLAVETLHNKEISKKEGYVASSLMQDGDTWADTITFESMLDLQNFEDASHTPSESALAFYGFLNMNSCKVNRFSIEKSYPTEK